MNDQLLNSRSEKSTSSAVPQYIWQIAIALSAVGIGWILLDTIRFGNTGFGEKTLWDWMDLLIVPLLIPISVLWLTRRAQENERRIATYKSQREQLQAYYDRITDLLVKHKLGTTTSPELGSIARTLTLSVSSEVDDKQKGQMILFLYDTQLIVQPNIIELHGADFQKAVVGNKADLRRIHLRDVNLRQSDFRRANLFRADLRKAQLQGADLSQTILMQANLREAYMANAKLVGTVLKDTDFRWSDLRGANLNEADLTDTDLRRADLTDATFRDSVLINTNFLDAKIKQSQLGEAKTVTNVTLPDGAIYNKA